jgi:uncharacterized oxidoreductase
MQLSGNHILITGGATGIGFAMAEAFLKAGSQVAICGRKCDLLKTAQAQHPALKIHICDVTRDENRRDLLAWTAHEMPELNILINNAGVQRDIDFTHGLDEFLAGENELRVNLEAPVLLAGLFIPLLARNPRPAIVNVSSGLGFVPAARMPVYSASKAGMHAFSMAMRLQLAPLGFKLFEVIPPAVDTPLNSEGRAKRGGFKPDLDAATFVAGVMQSLAKDIPEIGFGMTADFIKASRAELDRRFQEMNRHM